VGISGWVVRGRDVWKEIGGWEVLGMLDFSEEGCRLENGILDTLHVNKHGKHGK